MTRVSVYCMCVHYPANTSVCHVSMLSEGAYSGVAMNINEVMKICWWVVIRVKHTCGA